jgi:hypothetical protein
MFKSFLVTVISALTLTACAQTVAPTSALNSKAPVLTPISAGASDTVGQYIVAAMQAETQRLEASAAPVRDTGE